MVKLERRKSKLTSVGGGEIEPSAGRAAARPCLALSAISNQDRPRARSRGGAEFDSPPDDDLTLVRPGPVPKVERMPEGIEVVRSRSVTPRRSGS